MLMGDNQNIYKTYHSLAFFSACPYDMPLWGGSNGEIQPDSESLQKGICNFGLGWDECVLRTEIINEWDGYSYWEKSCTTQVNSSLRSYGLTFCCTPGELQKGAFSEKCFKNEKGMTF